MRYLGIGLVTLLLASCSGPETGVNLSATQTDGAAGDTKRICRPVKAVATGFGEDNVTGFANTRLDSAINDAKDALVREGAKGFSIEDRNVACEDYIDFGGAIGREHLCRASASVCGQIPS